MPAESWVRAFQVDDEAEVIALWGRCELLRPWNDPHKDIQRKLAVQPELFLVAGLGSRIVGTAMGGYDGHRGSVYYLAVDPAQQGSGVGRELMRQLELRLIELGCPKLNLLVRTTNLKVQGFYKAIGYEPQDVACLGKRLIPDE